MIILNFSGVTIVIWTLDFVPVGTGKFELLKAISLNEFRGFVFWLFLDLILDLSLDHFKSLRILVKFTIKAFWCFPSSLNSISLPFNGDSSIFYAGPSYKTFFYRTPVAIKLTWMIWPLNEQKNALSYRL